MENYICCIIDAVTFLPKIVLELFLKDDAINALAYAAIREQLCLRERKINKEKECMLRKAVMDGKRWRVITTSQEEIKTERCV